MELFIPLIHQIFSELLTLTPAKLKDLQRTFAKKHKMHTLPSKSQLLQTYFHLIETGELEKNADFETLLKKRAIRSLSGIVSVQVLTKPRPCPWQCIFCPNDPTMPKSYIKSEPGASRAFLNQFDPVKQVYNRLQSLTLTGHTPDKIEMIVLGGSRDAYEEAYKVEFIKGLYDACNTFSELDISMHNKYGFDILNLADIQLSNSLEEAIEKNQTAKHRMIGLTIETRPDLVSHENCQKRRQLWVTRIEMGVQSTDDEILRLNKRGHTIAVVQQAMHLMRQYGFKISIHLMPWLYGSTLEKDIQTFREIFSDPYFKPDELKFYPTSVIPNTELFRLYQAGEYQPITTEEILQIIKTTFQEIIPPYTRIKRLIRDIPAPEIAAGSSITNLSQLAHDGLLREYKESLRSGFNDKDSSLPPHEFGSVQNDGFVGREKVLAFYKRLYGDFVLTTPPPYGHLLPQFWRDAAWQGGKLCGNEQEGNAQFTPLSGGEGAWGAKFTKAEEGVAINTTIIWTQPDLTSYRHFVSLDTRSREVRNKTEKTSALNLIIRQYESSVGSEFFISYEDELGYLYGFTRLLLPLPENTVDYPWLGKGTAIIRELHIYGELQKLGEKSASATQHTWLGKKLLSVAEKLAQKAGFSQLSIISGVGVREYYLKNGYELVGTYMVMIFPNSQA